MSDLAMESYTENDSTLFQNKNCIKIGVNCRLTLKDARLLAKKSVPVLINPESFLEMQQSFNFLSSRVEERSTIYGINTHFGDQVNFLDPYIGNKEVSSENYYESINTRQKNLIRSHSCGLGNTISTEIVKVTMMLRAHCLAQGYSGVSIDAVQAIVNFLNSGIVPVVRSYGSIGASGDLIPLAMIAAAIIGENVNVFYNNKLMKAPQAIQLTGLPEFNIQCRDGLAMINGTSFMTAISSLALYKLKRLFNQLLAAIAMSLEAMLVIESAYHPLVHQLKQQTGAMIINRFLLDFWRGTELLSDLDNLRVELKQKNTEQTTKKHIRSVQDYYSLRAICQGFGPFMENLEKMTSWVENEMNAINDNPIIDAKEQNIHHTANFMGYYITDACDILKMDIAQASTWIHALLANMVHPRKNQNLPANLVPHPDIQNGFRPIQLLAASLAIQNRKLAQSQQSYMLPTEGDNQDVNSLGTHAAIDFQESVNNLERLTAILLLAAVQALEFRNIKKASHKAKSIHKIVRESVGTLTECRPMTEDLEKIILLLEEEKI